MNPFTSAVSEISGNPVHIAGLPLTLGFIADFAGLHAQPEADVLIYAMFMAVCVLFAVCINLHVTFPTKEITDISERKRLLDTLDRFRKTCTAVYFLNTAVFAAALTLAAVLLPLSWSDGPQIKSRYYHVRACVSQQMPWTVKSSPQDDVPAQY